MAADISRILIETVVKMTLRNIKDSPERNIRNLVDMAQEFSIPGRFSRQLFETAQEMLRNENSPYYALIRDTVSMTDHQRLLTLGMNIGYNSCAMGANTIRQIEAAEGFNIPWTIILELDGAQFPGREKEYASVIAQGKELGVYTWLIFASCGLSKVLPLAQNNGESAFVIFCRPEEITEELLAEMKDIPNVMLTPMWEEGTENACQLLRREGFPYAICARYGKDQCESILNETLVRDMEQLHPIFSLLLPKSDCPEKDRQKVYDWITESRKVQRFQTVLMDVVSDCRFIDGIISEDSCSAVFDAQGSLLNAGQPTDLNLFQVPLKEILRQTLPKKM